MAKLGIFSGFLFGGVGMYLLYKKFYNKNSPSFGNEIEKTMLANGKKKLISFVAGALLSFIVLIKRPGLYYH